MSMKDLKRRRHGTSVSDLTLNYFIKFNFTRLSWVMPTMLMRSMMPVMMMMMVVFLVLFWF